MHPSVEAVTSIRKPDSAMNFRRGIAHTAMAVAVLAGGALNAMAPQIADPNHVPPPPPPKPAGSTGKERAKIALAKRRAKFANVPLQDRVSRQEHRQYIRDDERQRMKELRRELAKCKTFAERQEMLRAARALGAKI